MTAQTAQLQDPHTSLGAALLAHERRQNLFTLLKLALVWVALIVIVFGALLAMQFDVAYIFANFNVVLRGLGTTIFISLAAVLLASVLALMGALGRLSSNPIASGLSSFYVSLVRGTPLLVQLYVVYLGLPRIGTYLMSIGYDRIGRMFILNALMTGILALGVNYGAYMTEIFRAGIQSVGHGQWEAAQAIGMSPWQTMRRIILPQAIRVIIPDIGNQFIAMQKDSTLVSVFGLWEMTYLARELGKRESKYLEMFLVAAILYWILTMISTWIQQWLERSMAHAYER